MKQKKGSGTYVIDDNYTVVTYNSVAKDDYPSLEAGKKCFECISGTETPCFHCPVLNQKTGPNNYVEPVHNNLITIEAIKIPLQDSKEGNAIVYHFSSEEDSTNARDNNTRVIDIINALSINYSMVFSVDVDSHLLQVLRSEKDITGLHEAVKEDNQYTNVLKAFVKNNVYEEDRRKVIDGLSYAKVIENLKSTPSFKVHFRIVKKGEVHYYYCKCVRAEETKELKNFLLAFANEDTDVNASLDTFDIDKKRKILVVEDNTLNRSMLVSILEDSYDCMEAKNGVEALQIIQSHYQELSCVLLDIQMPLMNGFQVLERLHADSLLSSIPIIVTTGSDRLEDELKCLDLGASDYITKPYNPRAIHARVKNIIKLKESANTISDIERDFLTDLYTEQAFYHHAKQYIIQNSSKRFHLCAANIKGLRVINDIYGEKAGDDVITYLANQLRHYLPNALISRTNGDHFIFLVDERTYIKKDTIDSLCRQVSKDAPVPNVMFQLGIYLDIDVSLPLRPLCDRALSALNSISNDYITYVAFYDNKLSNKFLFDRQLENNFESAIENHEFVTYYQPKYSVCTGQIEGAEALVRWIKNGKMVPPNDFIPLFESDGLIVKLDQYMFESVVKAQHEHLVKRETTYPISINLSRASLHNPNVVPTYLNILKKYDVPFNLVPIELTETATYYGTSFVKAARRLVDAGFELHLDDFGTGYSSLISLNELPFTVLKLDKSLIDNITDERGKMLIYYITTLAHAFGITVLAEGVETQEQVNLLKQVECDVIQGYYYSKPVNAEEFNKLLSKK